VDSDGIQREAMGKVSQFRRFVYCSLDSSTISPVARIFVNLGVHRGWTNLSNCQWWENYHWSNINCKTICC
jgi:hypothetical protein